MADHSAIEWTGATWSPVVGCTKVDAACGHCYIERTPRLRTLGMRFERVGNESTTGLRFFEHMLDPDYVRRLRPRDEPVFVCSLSDLFHEDVSDEFIGRVWNVMDALPERTFQVLTKRPERARDFLRRWYGLDGSVNPALAEEPNANVWVGTSIGTARYTWRADVLREIPAAVRFLSCEPLLGSLYAEPLRGEWPKCFVCARRPVPVHWQHLAWCDECLDAHRASGLTLEEWLRREHGGPLDLTGIDWVIVGGESGKGTRPMELEWVAEILLACREAGAAPFVKQLGTVWARQHTARGLDCGPADPKGGKWEHWPPRLRVREMPKVPA